MLWLSQKQTDPLILDCGRNGTKGATRRIQSSNLRFFTHPPMQLCDVRGFPPGTRERLKVLGGTAGTVSSTRIINVLYADSCFNAV
jgi:hypothetical protein